jgi:hypothetical protein
VFPAAPHNGEGSLDYQFDKQEVRLKILHASANSAKIEVRNKAGRYARVELHPD